MSKPQLASIDHDGWMIDDGEVAHSQNPDTFWIPPLQDRQSLEVNDYAKIRFYIRIEEEDGKLEDYGERMWVKVLGRLDDWYRGELDNQPNCTAEITSGLEVWSQPRHVIDIQRAG